jgi:hypothetical protein
MGANRRGWLERITGWATAVAVPLVAIVGLKLLIAAHDAERKAAPDNQRSGPTAGRVFAPPIDASAPPVVELHPPVGGEAVPGAPASDSRARCQELLRDSSDSARAESRRLRCTAR